MALLNTFIPNASADVVGVFNDALNQVFTNARAIKASVVESSKVMEHPVEDGTVVTDHRVIQPITIELSLMLGGAEYRSVYQQIRQIFYDGRLLTVQTKTSSYRNMIIEEMPHTEEAELFDLIPVALKLREVLFVTAQFGALPASKVRNKSASSTATRGQVQSKEATPTETAKAKKQSIAKRGADKIKKYI